MNGFANCNIWPILPQLTREPLAAGNTKYTVLIIHSLVFVTLVCLIYMCIPRSEADNFYGSKCRSYTVMTSI